jgi:hypothetical protein
MAFDSMRRLMCVLAMVGIPKALNAHFAEEWAHSKLIHSEIFSFPFPTHLSLGREPLSVVRRRTSFQAVVFQIYYQILPLHSPIYLRNLVCLKDRKVFCSVVE